MLARWLAHPVRFVPLALALAMAVPAAAAPARKPALVVLLVVDQMRADYPERFGHQWDGGLARLFAEGAWYRQAAYPYLQTVTCTGHATLSTGTWPRRHGVILNGWWDRQQRKTTPCTRDERVMISDGSKALSPGESARLLLTPTLSDRMRAQLQPTPRVVTMAVKARSAIMLAGHRADLAVWFAGNGRLVTSTALGPSVPTLLPVLASRFNVDFDSLAPWTRLLPRTSYHFLDNGLGEKPPAGWTTSFPHEFKDVAPRTGAFARWMASPAADGQLLRLAGEVVREMKLGRGRSPDFLAVSLSALDLTGHAFGPRSHEAQDVLVRLDRGLADFLAILDKHVGRGRYTVALSADHGVALLPEYARGIGLEAGRIDFVRMAKEVEAVLHPALAGQGAYIDSIEYTDLYFAPGIYQQITKRPALLAKVLGTIKSSPGVADAFTADDLREIPGPEQPLRRAAAFGFHPDRSGDIVLVPRPNWITVSAGTTHGTANEYDQHVPLVLWGAGVRPGRYDRPVTPADIAPTLARLLGFDLPAADGTVLVEAVK